MEKGKIIIPIVSVLAIAGIVIGIIGVTLYCVGILLRY